MPVELVDGAAKVGGGGVDKRFVPHLAQKLKKDPHRAGEELALKGGQNAAPEGAFRLGGVQDVLLRQHVPLPGEGAAQDEVGGHAVVVAGPDDKAEARLPDAVFIMGQEGLGDAQFPGGGPLADALLLPQQGQGAGKL